MARRANVSSPNVHRAKRAAIDRARLEQKVKEAIRSVAKRVPAKRIRPEATLIECEIDSLRVVELTIALERTLGAPVFLHDWISRVNHPRELTVGSLIDYLAATIGSET
jgi:acyl carrier protein